MSFAVKKEGLWWNQLVYPRVPYLFNLRMDPMVHMDQESHEFGYIGRKLFAQKMWTLIPAQGVLAQHIETLQKFPPRQRAESLSMEKAMDSRPLVFVGRCSGSRSGQYCNMNILRGVNLWVSIISPY